MIMRKELCQIIDAFGNQPSFRLAQARKLTDVSHLSSAALCNLLRRETQRKNSWIGKLSHGVYCVKTSLAGSSLRFPRSGSDVLFSRYLQRGKQVEGYVSGLSFLNQIGYSDDVPGRLELVSNFEKSRGREIRLGEQRAYLRRPLIKVTKENVRILPVFDVLSRSSLAGDPSFSQAVARYFAYQKVGPAQIKEVYEQLPLGSKKRIVLGNLIDGIVER
jgi:hypothetical protein